MNSESFESKIKKYAEELLRMNRDFHPQSERTYEKEAEFAEEIMNEEDLLPEEKDEEDPEEMQEEAEEETEEETEEAEPLYETDKAEEEPESFAFFSARVFTGNNAYPVENARVIVTRNNKLFTYLSTDSDGATGRIKLPASPESNSLDPESKNQSTEYRGEVYAVGFTPKKNLLISAVGGSDIVLNVQMTPLSERMN